MSRTPESSATAAPATAASAATADTMVAAARARGNRPGPGGPAQIRHRRHMHSETGPAPGASGAFRADTIRRRRSLDIGTAARSSRSSSEPEMRPALQEGPRPRSRVEVDGIRCSPQREQTPFRRARIGEWRRLDAAQAERGRQAGHAVARSGREPAGPDLAARQAHRTISASAPPASVPMRGRPSRLPWMPAAGLNDTLRVCVPSKRASDRRRSPICGIREIDPVIPQRRNAPPPPSIPIHGRIRTRHALLP